MSDLTLTQQQHDEVSRLSTAGRTQVRPAPPGPKPARYPGVCRVIAMETLLYDSTVQHSLPFFAYTPNRFIWNVEFVGELLSGYVVLTIDSVKYTLEVRRTSLADLLNQVPKLLRATVLPGLWELIFEDDADVTCRSVTLDEQYSLCQLFDLDYALIFNGTSIVRREAWGTLLGEGTDLASLNVTDCIPFHTSNVRAGAIGVAQWAWDAGFIVTGWQCRSFSYAPDYVQAADPIPLIP